ncbi:MAG: hypothetical protein WCS31_00950 [Verrucomicrobiae bacterium]
MKTIEEIKRKYSEPYVGSDGRLYRNTFDPATGEENGVASETSIARDTVAQHSAPGSSPAGLEAAQKYLATAQRLDPLGAQPAPTETKDLGNGVTARVTPAAPTPSVFAGTNTLDDMAAGYRAALAANAAKGAAITAQRAAKDAENPNFFGNTLPPLSEFRAGMDRDKAVAASAQKDLDLENQGQALARLNMRALRSHIASGRIVPPDLLQKAQGYLAERNYGLGQTNNVDDQLGFFKKRALKRWQGVPATPQPM